MDIKVYLLPPDSMDFKEKLIKEALEGVPPPDYSGVLYLAPTRLLLESARGTFHRGIASGRTCYIPPAAMTLRQCSRNLALTYGGKTLIPDAAVPALISAIEGCGMGLAGLLAGFISELKLRYPGGHEEAIKRIFSEALRETNLPEEVSLKISDALRVFGRYNEALASSGVIDDDDALSLSVPLAGKLNPAKRLLLDGFYEITRAEENFMAALIEKAEKIIITIPVSGPEDNLDYCWSNFLKARFAVEPVPVSHGREPVNSYFYPSPSPEEEMEGIARHIKSSHISGRIRRLDAAFVLFPDLEKYRLMAGRVFEKYGIPHRITSAPPASKNRAYLDMLAMIEAVEGNYPRLAFSRFLTSPYFRISPELRAGTPQVSLSSGIVRGKDAWLRAFKAAGLYDAAREVFEKLSPIEGARLSPGGRLTDGLSGRLEGVLKSFGFSPGEDENAGGLEKILSALRLIELILDKVSVPEIKGVPCAPLIRQLLDMPVGGEEGDGVRIAGFFEARGLEPRFLYMAGMKDGDMPSKPEIDFLLPNSIRKELGLPDMKRHLLLQEYIFRRLAASSGSLRASYPAMEGDRFFLPSPFLSGWEEKKERLFGIFSKEEETLGRGKSPAAPPSTAEVSGVKCVSENTPINVTAIDSYRMCPRLFFLEKILGLAPPEIKEYEVEPEALGSIAHEVMEKLITPEPGDIAAFTERAGTVLDETLRKWPIENYFKALIKETFLSVLPEIHELEKDLRKNGCSFLEAERRVEGEPVKGIRLKGKIDRIDIDTGGSLHIIDYKTGSAGLSRSGVLKRGEALQLFLYAAVLKSMGLEPSRAGLYSLKDLSLKWMPSDKDHKEGRGLETYMDSSLNYLKETVINMRKGDFPALPLKEQTCRKCREKPYCPRIRGGKKNGKKREAGAPPKQQKGAPPKRQKGAPPPAPPSGDTVP